MPGYYHTLSESELLNRLKSGDEKAFTEIYNRYWEKLLAIGMYFAHNKQSAEDIVHEVMMSLWVRKTEIEIESLQSYLATAVKFSVFKSIARDNRRKDLLADKPVIEFSDDIQNQLDARFLEEYLQRNFEKLPEKARLVFSYSRNEEFTVAEIAKKLDVSPKAVEYHITKSLRTLREALKKIKSFFV